MDDDLEKRDRTQPCEHPPLPRGILDPAGASARIRIWRYTPSIVAEIRREGGAARVETLADAFGMSLRAMQRLFREYVGVSPKWVIQRYRLQDAAYRLASDRSTQLAGLATELGYFDQAHLTKDFCRAFGISPAQYQRKQVSTRTSTIDRSSHL